MEIDEEDGDSQDWLVRKTHHALKEKDLYEAKCWLVTAKCLFPLNFKVQVQRFSYHDNILCLHIIIICDLYQYMYFHLYLCR